VCELCLWLADTPDLRARGLMQVTDLEGADGMAFVYDEPSTGRFWMKDTLLPLSIAFYDADGRFLWDADMEPCPPGGDCPSYPNEAPFQLAIEVPQGALASLALVDGSIVVLGGPCDPRA
jgi:uncharacterized membrane protein (UPF0127 family)